jgi:hypothetical protein
LFDLKNDPDELRNLAYSPAQRSRIDQMKADLRRQLPAAGDASDWTTGFDG